MASSASLAETNLPATWPEALFLVPRANGLADLPHSFDSCLSRKACERAAATASASECGKHANGHVANIAERRVVLHAEYPWLSRFGLGVMRFLTARSFLDLHRRPLRPSVRLRPSGEISSRAFRRCLDDLIR